MAKRFLSFLSVLDHKTVTCSSKEDAVEYLKENRTEVAMRKKITTFSFLFVLMTLVSIGVMSCETAKTETAENPAEQMITVLNPALSTSMAERIPLTARIDSIEGKTIYLVDLQWGGPEAAYSVFDEMKDWFSRNMPSVNVEIRRSSGGPFGDDPELRNRMRSC